MKAMILAAGRGERLRPLTDTLPKPLIEVRGKPLIVWHLERLAAAGLREIVINVSHLGELIMEALGDGARWGVAISWSKEAQPLETAGGLAYARALLGDGAFLVVNADVYCEFPFGLLGKATLGESLGHIVMVPNPPFRPQGDFSLAQGKVGNHPSPRYTYSGLGLFDPRIVEGLAAGDKAPLAPLLREAAESGRLNGELFTGLWSDVGNPERLAALNGTQAR
jgi:MurNAc alpha-1-phosphate uridylyltransferase